MVRKLVRVAFAKFWPGFDPQENLFTGLLRKSYAVELSDRPDFVFFSVFKGEMPPGRYVRIFYTGENVRPAREEWDWAFSFDYDEELQNPRHLRLPNYVFESGSSERLIKDPARTAQIKQAKTRFCNFVYSNPVRLRNAFYRELSQYRPIDAPGCCMQNMPPIGSFAGPLQSRHSNRWARDKVAWLEPYQFTIAFENGSHPGYTTEKIFHAMCADSIPIYWGNPLVHRDFNPKSFVNVHDFQRQIGDRLPRWLIRSPGLRSLVQRFFVLPRAMDAAVRRVIEICENDALYEQYLREPWCYDNRPSRFFDFTRLEQRLGEIFGSAPADDAASAR